jgi:hypothetical protein
MKEKIIEGPDMKFKMERRRRKKKEREAIDAS